MLSKCRTRFGVNLGARSTATFYIDGLIVLLMRIRCPQNGSRAQQTNERMNEEQIVYKPKEDERSISMLCNTMRLNPKSRAFLWKTWTSATKSFKNGASQNCMFVFFNFKMLMDGDWWTDHNYVRKRIVIYVCGKCLTSDNRNLCSYWNM